jgi:hypothetical protein
MYRKDFIWRGLDHEARMEIAHVTLDEAKLTAHGTQIGSDYELRYELSPSDLSIEVVGARSVSLQLGDADFFDLGYSPLFNSLPVLRDDLLTTEGPHSYSMLWVSVPDLEVERSEQRYSPLGANRIRFSAGKFEADLSFDEEGFVLLYPGLAIRVSE